MEDDVEEETSVQPRRRSGCLRGCLIVVVLLLLAVGGTIGYVAWNMYGVIHSDARLQAILQTVRGDGRAQAVLGSHYAMMEVEHQTFPAKTGNRLAEAYELVLIGGTGKSFLDVRLEPGAGGMKLVSMVLTGPEGQQVTIKAQHKN